MKHTTNTLSTLYRSIDQTKISDKAKETLKKLRLATGNFVGKDEEAKQLFVDFFNKLKESKPIAVKTTPEYKKALRDAQRERGKALGEKRKKESQDKKGTGNDIDASRPAKPYGWRMRGKHNYKKPTRADITEGRAYYEGRVNRADVKRKKYPMLERGGYMSEGGEIMSKAERYANNPNWTNEKLLKEYDEAKFNLKQFEMGYLKPSKIIGTGYKSSAIAKKLAKEYCEDQVQIFKTALELRGVMAKGGNVYSSDDAYLVEIFKDDKKVDEKIIRARSKGEARENFEDLHEDKLKKNFGDDITYTIVLAPSKMAKGGMINHGFRSGDKIIEIYKGYGIIESKDVVEVINPSQGSRYVVDHGNTMDEQIDGAKRMIDNMTPIELVDRIEIGTDRYGSMDRRGVEYAKGGKLSQGDINKKVNDNISQYINGLSKGEALYVLREILKEALIDANYGEFQDKVDRIFKGAKKFVLVKNADETEQLFFDVGKQVAKVCKWDRIQIVEAIKYTCSMNGYGQMASEISQIYSTKTGKLNYVPKNKIKYFLIKNEYKSGEFRNMYSIYESNDVLNGANILEKGGILEDYKYFAKNKVIVIGADGKPIFDTVNGAWVKKSATPIGEIEKTEILDVDSWDDFLKHGESKFWVDDVVYNKKTKSIGIVRVQDDKFGEVKTDADGNVNVDDLEHYDPSRYPYQKNDFVIAPSTKKEIEDRNLFKPFERRKYAKGGVFYTEKHKND